MSLSRVRRENLGKCGTFQGIHHSMLVLEWPVCLSVCTVPTKLPMRDACSSMGSYSNVDTAANGARAVFRDGKEAIVRASWGAAVDKGNKTLRIKVQTPVQPFSFHHYTKHLKCLPEGSAERGPVATGRLACSWAFSSWLLCRNQQLSLFLSPR